MFTKYSWAELFNTSIMCAVHFAFCFLLREFRVATSNLWTIILKNCLCHVWCQSWQIIEVIHRINRQFQLVIIVVHNELICNTWRLQLMSDDCNWLNCDCDNWSLFVIFFVVYNIFVQLHFSIFMTRPVEYQVLLVPYSDIKLCMFTSTEAIEATVSNTISLWRSTL